MTDLIEEKKIIIDIPGSKSISNRVLLIAALAKGKTKIKNLLICDDTQAMLGCLKSLKVDYSITDDYLEIMGVDSVFKEKRAKLFANQSGTTGRFIIPAILLSNGIFDVDADEQLKSRPFGEVAKVLNLLKIDFDSEENFSLPFRIRSDCNKIGYDQDFIELTINGEESSQFLSGFLIASPCFGKKVKIKIVGELISSSYVDMTISIMKFFGADVSWNEDVIEIEPTGYVAKEYNVEPDASSASYFFALGALSPSHVIQINNLDDKSLQGDYRFVEVLANMGADVRVQDGNTIVSNTRMLSGVSIDMSDISDTMPTLAAIAPFCSEKVEIYNVGFIRNKESDRIYAMSSQLSKLGVVVEEKEDGVVVFPCKKFILNSDKLESFDDHRVVMSLAVILKMLKVSRIKFKFDNPECVNKTFPNFWEVFSRSL